MVEQVFNKNASSDKIIDGDKISAQVKKILAANNTTLPQTPRRPDVRMIVENISGAEIRFPNPGAHANGHEEVIPGAGDKRSVMVMVKGATLEEQLKNAKIIYDAYDMAEQGLSASFIHDMNSGLLYNYVDEAYGPAPFAGQASKLVDVAWDTEDGMTSVIAPEHGASAAYGARAATNEDVFLAQFHIYVKGTGTTAELVESSGMNIAISKDYNTGAETTRPIVPSVAKTYYGAHVGDIPVAVVHPNGKVREVILNNGTVLKPAAVKPRAAKTPNL